MASKVGYAFLDASGEISRVEMNITTLTAGNFAATTGAVASGGALADAISGLSLCTLANVDIVADRTATGGAAPVSNYAQREIGLLVSYQDSVTGKKYRVTIPGPDWATIGQAGSDMVDPADALWTAFVSAFEANVISEAGNAVTILGGWLVGRNR
jgi:hypothetical protein